MTASSATVAIIGGGAAGMTAAIAAARGGAKVLVIERMQRVGKKLLATGNGRCNLSNATLDVSRYHGSNPAFVGKTFAHFGLRETMGFFDDLGISLRTEGDGRMFPTCDQASSVLDALRHEMEILGVEVVCDTRIQRIEGKRGAFRCVSTEGREFGASRVVLAAGGSSSPNLGSNGGGFKIAAGLGHRIVEPFPALVQIRVASPYLKHLQGISFEGAAEVRVDGEVRRRERGEILFTDYGLSGIPVLHLGRVVSEHGERAGNVAVHLDFFPEASREEIESSIRKRLERNASRAVEVAFIGFLNKRLCGVLLKEAGIAPLSRPCGEIAPGEIARMGALVKNWDLPCAGTQSWMHSQVTAGGVDTREVNPETMESLVTPGVYLAGEVLDIDGDSGGYNLQWAWSTGFLAGRNAAQGIGGQ